MPTGTTNNGPRGNARDDLECQLPSRTFQLLCIYEMETLTIKKSDEYTPSEMEADLSPKSTEDSLSFYPSPKNLDREMSISSYSNSLFILGKPVRRKKVVSSIRRL